MRVIKLLVGKPPQTVVDLIDATGVTRTAVTEQLNELVAAGLVERGTERLPGRGRPRHVYKASSACLSLLFANSQSLVVPAIWRAIGRIGGDKLTKKVVGRVSLDLADHYKRRITARKPEERLRQLTGLLCDEGGLAETVQENGKLLMRKRSCPFVSMIDEKRIVCCVDLEMMSEVVGRRVRLVACRHEGDPCCIVEIVSDE
jgi:predicted ArsR family transcriptional regulator